MARKTLAALVFLAGAVYETIAVAAVPAVECRNCTAGAQEEQLALSMPGLGIRFVYNFRNHSIRKFSVYLDAPNRFVTDAIPVEPQPALDGKVETPSGVAVRTLYEMSVDPGVLSIFREIDSLNSAYPSNAFSKQFRVDISNLGLTNGAIAPRSFDPRAIGWEYPNGEGFNFIERLTDRLGGSSSAGSVEAPGWGD